MVANNSSHLDTVSVGSFSFHFSRHFDVYHRWRQLSRVLCVLNSVQFRTRARKHGPYLRYVPTLCGSKTIGPSDDVGTERTSLVEDLYPATDEKLARVETVRDR